MIKEIRDKKVQHYGLKAQYISAYGNAIRKKLAYGNTIQRDKKILDLRFTILDFANKQINKSTENYVQRHCEGDSPKQSRRKNEQTGLLRSARNDVQPKSPSFGGVRGGLFANKQINKSTNQQKLKGWNRLLDCFAPLAMTKRLRLSPSFGLTLPEKINQSRV